jgi:subtilisin family serine protease
MKKLFVTAIACSFLHFAHSQTPENWQAKTDASLLEKTANGQQAPFLILLKEQAHISAARSLKSKSEKASFVFNKLRQTAEASQAGICSFLQQQNTPFERLFIINAIKTEGPAPLVQALAQRDDVAYLLDNPDIRFEGTVEQLADESLGDRSVIEWGIERINADDVWALGYQGQGVTVGGQDTGYDWSHPALKRKYRGYHAATDTTDHNYNWHDAIHSISPLSFDSLNPCGLNSPMPCDDNSHGTHTMGTMIGLDGDNAIGVAPEAQWCACRNMERGNGSPFTYLECFQWFLAPTNLEDKNPDPSKAPHVINNSWYCSAGEGCNPSNFQVLEMAVNNLRLAGTVVVISAGNSGSGCGSVSNPPAFFENSFAIGATAINDTIAGFSSRGPVTVDGSNRLKPNVSAPGVNVRSSVPGGAYANFSGTSMAGPHVVGLVALMISANPDLAGQVDLIESIIEETAVPKTDGQNCGTISGAQVPNHTYGYGRVDALAAVEKALSLIVNPTGEVAPVVARTFPNPFDNQVFVEMKNAEGDVQAAFFDAAGRLVFQQKWNAAGQTVRAFDFTGQPSGVYFFKISNRAGVWQGRVVKH